MRDPKHRDIYKAIMVAAAKGHGLRLTEGEVFQLSQDDAIMTVASNALTDDELLFKDGGGYHEWEKVSPYPQGEPAYVCKDEYHDRLKKNALPMMEPPMPDLTEAQKRALEWLPDDGSWARKPGRNQPAVESLCHYHKTLAEMELEPYGFSGRTRWRYRLTPAGIALKAQMEHDNG